MYICIDRWLIKRYRVQVERSAHHGRLIFNCLVPIERRVHVYMNMPIGFVAASKMSASRPAVGFPSALAGKNSVGAMFIYATLGPTKICSDLSIKQSRNTVFSFGMHTCRNFQTRGRMENLKIVSVVDNLIRQHFTCECSFLIRIYFSVKCVTWKKQTTTLLSCV